MLYFSIMIRESHEDQVNIHVPSTGNPLLEQVITAVNTNEEVRALWKVINVNALDRLHMTDHGPVHFQIVSNIAIKILRNLTKAKVEMSITKDFGLSDKHAEVVVFLASVFHDLGMTINREGHEEFSLFLANNLLREILSFLPLTERTIVISETLHAIISHRKGGKPNTLEAGIVRVSDALDMTKGRARIPYEAGLVEIHSISHQAIDSVEILTGESKPILIKITMNNSAGVFQVDELLKSKLKGSGLEKYIEIKALISEDHERNLVKEFSF